MARHDQREKDSTYTCTACKEYDCAKCIDKVRGKLFRDPVPVCICKHEYEQPDGPTDQEIIDHLTGGKKSDRVALLLRRLAP